jgi:dTDP-4-amino-4,6-dideoxy-D-galactose acyltransferase
MAACALLDWDSRFFGRRIAQVSAARLDDAGLRAVEAWCDAAAVDCAYFLADFDPPTLALVERSGFGLKDVRLTFGRPLASSLTTLPADGLTVRAAVAADLPALEAIAAASHHDSRFYADERFGREQADALYRAWIRNSVEGWADDVLVLARDGEQAVGYITGHRRDGGGQIGLIAVAEEARGAGGAPALVAALCGRYAALGVPWMTVVTQARNLAAQRLYQRLGFTSQALGLWYHRWWSR